MVAFVYALAMAVLVVYGVNLLHLALVFIRSGTMRPGRRPCPPNLYTEVEPTWPSVTVQVPLYNEAFVARRVIDAVAGQDYPLERFDVQVLDDSDDSTSDIVQRAVHEWSARGLVIRHIQRKERTGYKAGALAHGLGQSRSALIAVFDADFVPRPDFLRRTVSIFSDATVGMVQARWGHLNARMSSLTRIQAFALDGHFALEQAARHAGRYFMSFNGTAGLWRRACIDDAGGWRSTTLTEDLDLSYRAQLKGWRFRYMNSVEAPAELPQDMSAWRAQQFRWTKGTAETAMQLLAPLWRARDLRWSVKMEGTLHLTAHVVYPCLLIVAVLHAPLLLMEHIGLGPGQWYFAVMGLSLTGLLGFFLAQLIAQRELYPDWGRRLLVFPVVMAGTMGMALSNTRAIWQALRQQRTPFERTPKHTDTPWWMSRYAIRGAGLVMAGEALLAAWSVTGFILLLLQGAWAALPFQALFALAFSYVTGWNVLQILRMR